MTRNYTPAELEEIIGDDVKARIEAKGQRRDKATKELAEEALDIIAELGEGSRMATYAVVAKYAGMAKDTIRKACNALEKIPDEYWHKYHSIKFSFFCHASMLDERMTEALDYAEATQCSLEELKANFPIKPIPEVEQALEDNGYPRQFTGIVRWSHEAGKWEAVKPLLDTINDILKGKE
jgi:DNA-binding ferritin-like protein (Dps family)